MKKLSFYAQQGLLRLVNLGNFKNDFLRTLPEEYHSAAKLAYYRNFGLTADEKSMGKKIESFRSEIPKIHTAEEVLSYGSPHKGTFEMKDDNHAKPGDTSVKDVRITMKTGSDIFKGTLLKRIVEGAKVKRVLELGTNTGFSACYFAAAENVEVVTVEGSEDLCKIADANIKRISKNYTIMNCLFDEAIDQLIAKGEQFDCVFIDGQHEEEATLHYSKRVGPLMKEGAVYIFDDIYWSDGMNQAWKKVTNDTDFSHGIDLFTVGVYRKSTGNKNPELFDIGNFLPRPKIYRKDW